MRLYALFGDQPRPLRPSHGGTGMVFGSILRPPGASTLRAEVVRCLACGGGGRACVRRAGGVAPHKGGRAPRRKRTTAALCRESGTRRRRVDRAQTVSVPKRQAVTAGRGPPCYTKAASRRSQPQTLRRPGPLFLWSQGPFLFPQKKKWTLPLPGRHPPEGLRPYRAGTPGGAPSKFSIASKYQIGYNSRRR